MLGHGFLSFFSPHSQSLDFIYLLITYLLWWESWAYSGICVEARGQTTRICSFLLLCESQE